MAGRTFDMLPDEILLRIFQHSSMPDLKSARLTCKLFRRAIDEHLFCHLILLGNVESFQRMQYLAASPLRFFVKRLTYSGIFLGGMSGRILRQKGPDHVAVAFRQWNLDKIKTTQQNQAQDEYHWEQFCHHIESQVTMQSGDADIKALQRSLRLFPRLREVEFRSGIENCCETHHHLDTAIECKGCCKPVFSRIARDTLIYPGYDSGKVYHGKQLSVLLAAAHTNPNITIFKTSEIPVGFKEYEASTYVVPGNDWAHHMRANSTTFKEVSIGITQDSCRTDTLLNCAKELESLHLYQHSDVHERRGGWKWNWNHKVLESVLSPCLTSLTLQKFVTPVTTLKRLLTSHKDTLRVLRLTDIRLTGMNPKDVSAVRCGWISLIQHMNTTLSHLTSVQLDGRLTGTGTPGFVTHDPHQTCSVCAKSPRAPEETLRYRIEDFVLRGASLSHHGREGEEAWMALAEESTRDCTWKVWNE